MGLVENKEIRRIKIVFLGIRLFNIIFLGDTRTGRRTLLETFYNQCYVHRDYPNRI